MNWGRYMKYINALIASITGIALSGCATVVNGTHQSYRITSEPAGAKVHLTNGTECVTPCSLSLKRKHDFRADISKDGYKPTYILVHSKGGGAVAGNLLIGGLIGGIVDSGNGANNHLDPNPLSVKLADANSTEEASLLDKNGTPVSTVQAHNEKVRSDVAKTIGVEAAGVTNQSQAGAAPAAP